MSNTLKILATVQAQLVELHVAVGQFVTVGTSVASVELMKMHHAVDAPADGIVVSFEASVGDMLEPGQCIAILQPATKTDHPAMVAPTPDNKNNDAINALRQARSLTLDDARPEAMAKRHAANKRSARENIAALIDEDSFLEFGQLVFAAQRTRRSIEDLKTRTPADGLVCGLATINAAQFGENNQCAVLHYDYTVLAGTQGAMNHAKTDRILAVANDNQLPVVFFTEGGGGRPGDVDVQTLAGLHIHSFAAMARLSGLVPLIGIASGYCFAGNAAFLGCCDVVIATKDASIGMGGPAMIEGGGLGQHAPSDVGPAPLLAGNGVVDILVDDEPSAIKAAQQYLGFFQGALTHWQAPDADALNAIIPANRLQVYDMRAVISQLTDIDSSLEIRAGFAPGMLTVLARIGGRPLGIIANNPTHLAGAIDHEAADKAARFMQLCDAHNLPILSLCDTPGIMVGPDSEQHANVRHASRLFVTGANLKVPQIMVVVRKAYGLGAMAMAGGGFHETRATVAWPSGEFGAMGLEGAVKLGFKRELDAIADPEAREAAFQQRVDDAYERGKALNAAPFFEFDAVIEPAETRAWISAALNAATKTSELSKSKRRPNIDTW
ncbi:MAG: carboxyl transferase domain-containing protein [Woeseiaceae bacterium]